ncbi:MAG: CHAT domain-containing protein [Lewinella sp.]
MTLEELKETVRQLIGRAKTEEALAHMNQWARDNHREQLKSDIALLKENLEQFDRDKMLGLLYPSEAGTRSNQITVGVLKLLGSIDEKKPIVIDEKESSSGPIKILMLTANPAGSTKLNLDKEHSIIARKLQGNQASYNMISKKAVSGTEFKEFTQQERPEILHFSGHGKEGKYAGIVVQNDDKNEEALIPLSGLKSLFKFFKKRFNIKVVVLNACYTEAQAATIAEHVDYVIGTTVAIGDTAASAFSSGFYFQLAEGDGFNIEDAFDSGRTEAVMKGAAEENFIIYKNGTLIEIS